MSHGNKEEMHATAAGHSRRAEPGMLPGMLLTRLAAPRTVAKVMNCCMLQWNCKASHTKP